jgi:hypothetical protein
MQSLTQQRCFNHFQREAAARCLECGQFFCRECITEHDDRSICAACLKKLAKPPLTQHRGFVGAVRITQFLLGVVILWFFFYLVGESLLAIPTSSHERTLWQAGGMNEE